MYEALKDRELRKSLYSSFSRDPYGSFSRVAKEPNRVLPYVSLPSESVHPPRLLDETGKTMSRNVSSDASLPCMSLKVHHAARTFRVHVRAHVSLFLLISSREMSERCLYHFKHTRTSLRQHFNFGSGCTSKVTNLNVRVCTLRVGPSERGSGGEAKEARDGGRLSKLASLFANYLDRET